MQTQSHCTKPFSIGLQKKVDELKSLRDPIKLGSISFDSALLLAPMSAICSFPFRLLMEDLGAGGTVSELISCHGINYKNEKTRQMLRIHPREKNIGIQLFGEDKDAMAKASLVAQEFEPKFVDINMGCPVRKVVSKGGGSALLKDPKALGPFLNTIKKALNVPLTIKIRTGWDEDDLNADEIIKIAHGEGVEFVAIHGRTRTQAYKGKANWDYIEGIKESSPLPIIGNGDLHTSKLVKEKMTHSNCDAFMLGRGPLRNPFIFLEPYLDDPTQSVFTPLDYFEVIELYFSYLQDYTDRERTLLIQIRKMIIWMAAGFNNVSHFRNTLFQTESIEDTLIFTKNYFEGLMEVGHQKKKIDWDRPFMAGGHG